MSDWIAALSIYEGEGTGGTLLSTQTVAGDGARRVRVFSLDTPVALTAGSKYTICMDADIVCQWNAVNYDAYPGGRSTYGATYDQWFRTYMDAGTFATALTVQPGTGNVGIGNAAPAYPLHMGGGAYCTGTQWQNASDRNLKDQFTAIEPRAVLDKVAALPITQWKYKSEPDGVKHLGPVAQDFHAAFGLGDNDKSIGTVDESGVALAAIQGLNQKLEEKNAALEKEVAELRTLVKTLAERVEGGGQ